jgi:hypothetical protein
MGMLTTAQLATLKAAINADGVLAALPNNSDTAIFIAQQFNANSSPVFTVWKTSVPIVEVGDNFSGTELAGLTTANNTRLQTIAAYSPTVNPSLADRRQFFDDVFSGAGGTITRPKLLALWKRPATRAEQLFATGTGSVPSPATLVFEGQVLPNEVEAARNN